MRTMFLLPAWLTFFSPYYTEQQWKRSTLNLFVCLCMHPQRASAAEGWLEPSCVCVPWQYCVGWWWWPCPDWCCKNKAGHQGVPLRMEDTIALERLALKCHVICTEGFKPRSALVSPKPSEALRSPSFLRIFMLMSPALWNKKYESALRETAAFYISSQLPALQFPDFWPFCDM